MKILGIDLSLNSTGIFKSDDTYQLIQTSLKAEDRLLEIQSNLKLTIEEFNPDMIGMEGLSYNSISSSKDEIAANFWMVRCLIREYFPNTQLKIIQVTEWRDHLFTKEERKQWTTDKKSLKELKLKLKSILDRKEKNQILIQNEQLILDANIKYLTWNKLPEPYKSKFKNEFGFNKGTFDLSDSYFIVEHLKHT